MTTEASQKTFDSDSSQNARTSSRSTKVRALLAGGLVLGLGAAVTLASWNDSEFAIGNFAVGSFNLQGSTNGSEFTDHTSVDGAATLPFELSPTNVSPGETFTAPFAVRLDADTTYDAQVTIASSVPTGTLTGFTYELLQTTSFGCSAETTGTSLVPAGTSLGTVAGTSSFALEDAASSAGPAVNLCFKVTAGPGIEQGATGTALWTFAAESQS